MNQIALKGDFSAVEKKYKNKYGSNPDVRKALRDMYGGLCCYCERSVGKSGQIEHLKPKAIYPEFTFEWENLHLACGDCNGVKSDKYDEVSPILDPVKDIPISDHLTYKLHKVKPLSDRGRTTRVDVGLDRDDLLQERQKVAMEVQNTVHEINHDPDNPAYDILKEELMELVDEEYGSLIKYIVDSSKQW